MLVLSRKQGERIVIGKEASVRLTVVKIVGNHVRIGIEADGLTVHREEVYLRESQERRADGGEPEARAEAA